MTEKRARLGPMWLAGKLPKAWDPGKVSPRDHATPPAPLPSRARIQASEEPMGQGCWAGGSLRGAGALGEREEGLRIPPARSGLMRGHGRGTGPGGEWAPDGRRG